MINVHYRTDCSA